jgi:hypothetical protein
VRALEKVQVDGRNKCPHYFVSFVAGGTPNGNRSGIAPSSFCSSAYTDKRPLMVLLIEMMKRQFKRRKWIFFCCNGNRERLPDGLGHRYVLLDTTPYKERSFLLNFKPNKSFVQSDEALFYCCRGTERASKGTITFTLILLFPKIIPVV